MNQARSPLPFPKIPDLRPTKGPVLVEPPRPGSRWLSLLVIGIIGLGAAGWWRWMESLSEAKQVFIPSRTATVRTGSLERTLRITGTTSANSYKYLVAPKLRGSRSGRGSDDLTLTLLKLLPKGTRVKKGQVVAEFDRQFMILRVDDQRSNVIQQEATLRKLRAALDLKRAAQELKVRRAKAAMDKAELDLKTIPVRSVIASERLRMNHEEATAQYKQYLKETPFVDASEQASIRRYEIEVIQAENELKKAQKNADDMVFHAPIDGILVLQRIHRGAEYTELEEGDIIGSGQTFAEIMDTSKLVVEALVNQVDGEQIKNGYRATVHLDAFPEVDIPAKVVSIGAVTAVSGQRVAYVRSIPLRLELENGDDRVIPNLTASADILIDSKEDSLVVPLEYVFRDEKQRPYAVVQTESGWERRGLELGLANNVEVAVQSGVKNGDVLSASDYVVNSDK